MLSLNVAKCKWLALLCLIPDLIPAPLTRKKEVILASPTWIQGWWQDDQSNQVFREADEHRGDADVQYDAEVI
jgi:hypothetical protein